MDLVELKKTSIEAKRHPWEIVRAEIAINKISQLNLPKNSIILDVGCGDTFFLKKLSEKFPDNFFIGVDIEFNDELILELKEGLPSNIDLTDNLSKLNLKGKKVSLVLLMDVIEHVPDDKALIELIDFELKRTGNTEYLFLITVPAFQYLFSNHDVFLKHYRRYTLSMLNLLQTNLKLQKIDGGYFFTSLFIGRNIVSFLEKIKVIKSDAEGVSDYKGGALSSFIYKLILRIDYYCFNLLHKIGINMPGLSTYIICQRH